MPSRCGHASQLQLVTQLLKSQRGRDAGTRGVAIAAAIPASEPHPMGCAVSWPSTARAVGHRQCSSRARARTPCTRAAGGSRTGQHLREALKRATAGCSMGGPGRATAVWFWFSYAVEGGGYVPNRRRHGRERAQHAAPRRTRVASPARLADAPAASSSAPRWSRRTSGLGSPPIASAAGRRHARLRDARDIANVPRVGPGHARRARRRACARAQPRALRPRCGHARARREARRERARACLPAGSEKKGAGTKRTSEKKGAAPRCTSEEKAEFVGGFMHTESAGPWEVPISCSDRKRRARVTHEGRVPTRHGRGPAQGVPEMHLQKMDNPAAILWAVSCIHTRSESARPLSGGCPSDC